jgi:hypothetical protein
MLTQESAKFDFDHDERFLRVADSGHPPEPETRFLRRLLEIVHKRLEFLSHGWAEAIDGRVAIHPNHPQPYQHMAHPNVPAWTFVEDALVQLVVVDVLFNRWNPQ